MKTELSRLVHCIFREGVQNDPSTECMYLLVDDGEDARGRYGSVERKMKVGFDQVGMAGPVDGPSRGSGIEGEHIRRDADNGTVFSMRFQQIQMALAFCTLPNCGPYGNPPQKRSRKLCKRVFGDAVNGYVNTLHIKSVTLVIT